MFLYINFGISHLSPNMTVYDFQAALRNKEDKSLFYDIFNDEIDESIQSATKSLVDEMYEKLTKKLDKININFLV